MDVEKCEQLHRENINQIIMVVKYALIFRKSQDQLFKFIKFLIKEVQVVKNPVLIMYSFQIIGKLYLQLNQPLSALKILKQVKPLIDFNNEFYFKLKNYKLLAKIFIQLKKLEISKNYLIKMI